MIKLIDKFKTFFKPDEEDIERVKRWEAEIIDPDKPKKSLTIEDFEKAKSRVKNAN